LTEAVVYNNKSNWKQKLHFCVDCSSENHDLRGNNENSKIVGILVSFFSPVFSYNLKLNLIPRRKGSSSTPC